MVAQNDLVAGIVAKDGSGHDRRVYPAKGGVPLDFLLKSGWALAVVAFDGAYERQWSAERRQSMGPIERTRLELRLWREEAPPRPGEASGFPDGGPKGWEIVRRSLGNEFQP